MIVIKISPSVACSIPTISFAIVDFPEPLCPTMDVH